MKIYSKSYEIKNNTILESYFDISICKVEEFIQDYISNYPAGIFIIMNKPLDEEYGALFDYIIKDNDKIEVFYNDEHENTTARYIGKSVKKALKFSYDNAISGQAILLCGVDARFDLFENILE